MKVIPFTIRDREVAWGGVILDVAGAVMIVMETETVDGIS